jgi:peptide/nickel transport system substrate-binding protein
MFDFEWINANLFGGLYHRTKSFFDESDLASTGRPADARERALLSRWPDAVRDDIMEGKWAPPVSDGSGRDRDMARHAITLLKQAGYEIRGTAMTRVADGERLSFEIMVGDRAQQRLAENFATSLGRIGVEARVRLVDEVQYQRRRQKFDFDMMPGLWLASASPGNEQRTRWGSASADQEASFNLAGARSPAIDALIDALLAAATPDDFNAAARALDRALLSGFYIVPLFHASDQWFAYSTKLAFPERAARFAAPLFGSTLDTWWRKDP